VAPQRQSFAGPLCQATKHSSHVSAGSRLDGQCLWIDGGDDHPNAERSKAGTIPTLHRAFLEGDAQAIRDFANGLAAGILLV
jgi:hypothetical protein